MTAGQLTPDEVMVLARLARVAPETVQAWKQENHRTTIGDQSYDLDDPVLARLRADEEPATSSERDTRPEDDP